MKMNPVQSAVVLALAVGLLLSPAGSMVARLTSERFFRR